jgi:tRNA-Thr(GGU) m(6)t(6)A37 methyltransferase TsaA
MPPAAAPTVPGCRRPGRSSAVSCRPRAGDQIIVLTWLDRARRDVLSTRPRDDPARALTGVFSTRSPDRPNPIGLHRVEVLDVQGLRILVSNLEALDATPILDIKPVLDAIAER